MTRFDTIKYTFPREYLMDYNSEIYDKTAKDDGTGAPVSRRLVLNGEQGRKRMSGVQLAIDQMRGYVEVRMSAKSLGSSYAEGLTIDTMPTAIDNIDKSGIARINKDCIGKAFLHTADVTDNIRLASGKKDVYDTLALLGGTIEGYATDYFTRGGRSVIFTRMVKTTRSKVRLQFYDKAPEIVRDRDFMQSLGLQGAADLQNEFKDVTRCESNLVTYAALRNTLGLPKGDPMLIDALRCDKKVNYETFKKMTTKQSRLMLWADELEGAAWCDVVKRKGYDFIAQEALYDYDAARRFAARFYSNRPPARVIKELKSAIQRVMKRDEKTNYIMQEILDALQAA